MTNLNNITDPKYDVSPTIRGAQAFLCLIALTCTVAAFHVNDVDSKVHYSFAFIYIIVVNALMSLVAMALCFATYRGAAQLINAPFEHLASIDALASFLLNLGFFFGITSDYIDSCNNANIPCNCDLLKAGIAFTFIADVAFAFFCLKAYGIKAKKIQQAKGDNDEAPFSAVPCPSPDREAADSRNSRESRPDV